MLAESEVRAVIRNWAKAISERHSVPTKEERLTGPSS